MKNEIMRLAEAMAVAMAGEKDAVALTEARAALGAAAEKLTAERDALKAELARPESTAVSMMRAENAALKDAARLALDALTNSTPDPMDGDDAYCRSGWKRHADASAALKAVL